MLSVTVRKMIADYRKRIDRAERQAEDHRHWHERHAYRAKARTLRAALADLHKIRQGIDELEAYRAKVQAEAERLVESVK